MEHFETYSYFFLIFICTYIIHERVPQTKRKEYARNIQLINQSKIKKIVILYNSTHYLELRN